MDESDVSILADGNGSNDGMGLDKATFAGERVGQEQIHHLLFGDTLSWQSIIYDLINTEQLSPWDIDLSVLSARYLEKIRALEEANFFVSSKVLLAAALLLRMKSEILIEQDLEELDAVLYGRKKDAKSYVQDRLELDEEIPNLIPRTPLPRFKKVTLHELMAALGKALKTETRRIKRVVLLKQQEIETGLSLPRPKINLREQIGVVYKKLRDHFAAKDEKLAFSSLSGSTIEEKLAHFIPLLHLENQQKVWLEQESHLEEIYVWLKKLYDAQHREELEQMIREVDEAMKEYAEEESGELDDSFLEVQNSFGTSVSDAISSREDEE
ncbi:MAG TPA: hypothetical protein VJK51_01425 [Candidatus Nanoarchaeia archaeon]|nr:hypothetical protein [Candidatus Nanoarchaeia archaeon]